MALTPNKKVAPAAAPEILPAVVQDVEAGQVAATQAQEAVAALARQLNYQGDLTPGVLENSARDAIRRIGMGIFELGGYLLLLKEAAGHGEFLPVLERLGVSTSTAQRYMTVALRFSKLPIVGNLEKTGVVKLVELLVLDDEQLSELAELGTTGELALDDVARMSVKELRQAVRGMRGEAAATAQLLDKKNQRIDRLEREKQLVARMSPDEALIALKREATHAAADAEGAVLGTLRQAVIALRDHAAAEGEATSQDVFAAGLVGQVQAQLNALRDEFGLPDVSRARDAELLADLAQWDK